MVISEWHIVRRQICNRKFTNCLWMLLCNNHWRIVYTLVSVPYEAMQLSAVLPVAAWLIKYASPCVCVFLSLWVQSFLLNKMSPKVINWTDFDENCLAKWACGSGTIDYILVTIQILSWILDHFPGFFTISRQGVNWHFAVCLSKLVMNYDEVFWRSGRGTRTSWLHFGGNQDPDPGFLDPENLYCLAQLIGLSVEDITTYLCSPTESRSCTVFNEMFRNYDTRKGKVWTVLLNILCLAPGKCTAQKYQYQQHFQCSSWQK